MRSPSSLIFLVLLGVWAAYFLQHWIRRRDHLATARSVEQFSAAMRVLEQRDSTPRTDLSEPAPRTWAVHPAPASRPQVLVKRAVPAEHPAPPRWTTVEVAPVGDPRPSESRPPARAPLPTRIRPSRRVRAALLLVALVELVVIAALVPFGLLPVWVLAPAVLALGGAFAYVRAGVRAEQALRAARRRRRAEEARRREVASPAARRPSRPSRQAAPPSTSGSVDRVATAGAGDETAESLAVEQDASGATETVVDGPEVVAEASAGTEEPEPEPVVEYVHLVDEDDIPLTWDPVPVPRPTYTMKARADRPEVPPAAVTPDPEPVSLPEAEGFEERRVAGA